MGFHRHLIFSALLSTPPALFCGTGSINAPTADFTTISGSITISGTVAPDAGNNEAFPIQVTTLINNSTSQATNGGNWAFAVALSPGANQFNGARMEATLLPGGTSGQWTAPANVTIFYDPAGPTAGTLAVTPPQNGGSAEYNLPVTVSWVDPYQSPRGRYSVSLRLNGTEVGSASPENSPITSVVIQPQGATLIQGANIFEAVISENPGAIEGVKRETRVRTMAKTPGRGIPLPINLALLPVLDSGLTLLEKSEVELPPSEADFIVSLRTATALDQIWEYDLYFVSGGTLKKITDFPGIEGGVVRLPHNQGYLFSHSRDMRDWDLFHLSADFNEITPFMADTDIVEGLAALSPDGGSLVITKKYPGQPFALYAYSLADKRERLLRMEVGIDLLNPVWHPGGDTIFGVANVAGNLDIFRYDIVTDSFRNLTQSREVERDPCCSANGRLLAWSERREGESQGDIILMNLETGERCNLTPEPSWDRMPQFIQDDRELLFISSGQGRTGYYSRPLESTAFHPFFNPHHAMGGLFLINK